MPRKNLSSKRRAKTSRDTVIKISNHTQFFQTLCIMIKWKKLIQLLAQIESLRSVNQFIDQLLKEESHSQRSRTAIGNHPSSFTPDYSKSTTKSAADTAQAEFAAKGAAINAKAEAKAAEQAKIDAEMQKAEEEKVQKDIAKLKAPEANKTVKEKEANAAKLKELEAKVADAQEAKTKEAIAGAKDTRKDEDVTLVKTKNKK